MKRIFFALVSIVLLPPALAAAPPEARLLRFPDIHEDFVVFVHGGDVWRAPSTGGEARRLTAHPGRELTPKISPDGRRVAFSGEHSGSRQVYVMPAEGGIPEQLTFYTDVGAMPPRGGFDDWIQDWSPDGRILVRMNRTPWGERMGRYFLVDPEGGLETPLALPEGGSASFSPDGKALAYCPVSREFRTWKRHRGGRAQEVWTYDLEANRSRRITDHPGTDNFPLWAGRTIYFTSDRVGTLNLFAFDLDHETLRQVTHFDDYDVLWPSLGPGAIVFMHGGDLHRLELATETVTRIPIRIGSERPAAAPRFVDVSGNVQAADLSPSGVRAIFEARGELFSVPAEKGPTRNLSRSPGVRERDPAWSPDGEWIAYLSDRSGEYELYLRRRHGSAAASPMGGEEPRRLTTGGTTWKLPPVWSPNGEKLAFGDKDRKLWIVDVASGELEEVDRGIDGDLDTYRFSPDSRWLAYEQSHPVPGRGVGLPGIALYSLEDKTRVMLGDGLTRDFEPTWSADGHYLFFVSVRDYQLRFSSFEFNYLYDRGARVYAAALHPGAPALFPFESDEETGAGGGPEDEKKDGDEKEGGKKEEEKKVGEKKAGEKKAGEKDEGGKKPEVRVEAEGFVARTIALPGVAPSNYFALQSTAGALYYLRADDAGATLMRYDLAERKEESVLAGVQGYRLSGDGKKLLYTDGQGWGIADARAGLDPGAGRIDLGDLRLKIDPRVEWRQLYEDGWRIVRDFFYDPNMHGFDWQALGEKYRTLVPHVAHRAELDFLFGELIGELEAGHMYVQSGDEPTVERVAGGMLGAELELDAGSGRYRIAKIFPGENWDSTYRSPLTEPGVEAYEGDYLLAIDGEALAHPDNPYRLLEGKADRQVGLTLSADAAGKKARRVIVQPVASELDLRYLDWVKSRMAMTERLSGGRIGYLHLPNTAIGGNRMLQKLFYGQVNKEALIIDERYNGGGFIPDRMIEMLARRTLSYWARRDLEPTRTPLFSHDGPKAMLINSYSSSGGDALPYYFKKLDLGPLIGTRTWGGLIGVTGAPALADGGVVLPATFRFYDDEGRWAVENEGVAPDVEVIDLPEARIAGNDPSLEKAVEILLQTLEEQPVVRPAKPEPPDLSGDP